MAKVLGQFQFSDYKGDVNPFLVVTGRRIGPKGLEAVRWAATQTKDHDMQFTAKYYSGFLKEEYEKYSTEQLLTEWRSTVASLKPPLYEIEWSIPAASARLLGEVLVERGREVIVPVTRMLVEDRNVAVKEVAIDLLNGIDLLAVRLRKSDEGRAAIAAVYVAVLTADLAVTPNRPEIRNPEWKRLREQFEQDDFHLNPHSTLVLAFEEFYGAELPLSGSLIRHLTELDPQFPSWEFVPTGTQ